MKRFYFILQKKLPHSYSSIGVGSIFILNIQNKTEIKHSENLFQTLRKNEFRKKKKKKTVIGYS